MQRSKLRLIGLSLLSEILVVASLSITPVVYADEVKSVPLSLQDQAILIASKYSIDVEKFVNLVNETCTTSCDLVTLVENVKQNSFDAIPICNCYLSVKARVPSLPPMRDINPQLLAKVGSVAVFDYNGLPHFAYVTRLDKDTITILETNFEPCKKTMRTIARTDPALLGYFTPSEVP